MVQHGATFHGGPSTVNPSFATPNLHLIAHCARAILSSHHHQKRDQEKKKKKRGRLTAATHQQHARPDKRLRSTRRPRRICPALLGSALLTQGICLCFGQAPAFFSALRPSSSRVAQLLPPVPHPSPPLSRRQTPDSIVSLSLARVSPATRPVLHFFCASLPCFALPLPACRC